ncbi:uncharacterized protein LOC105253545 isoform X1 [Camponotus floridanus]|uniref:uncharacterized protein LOC105253545 isoform X1 n=1 Tax=Camponotus floridanus TaxID=104421 RepID=UPI000DC66B9C|nr:uncharacterized protein LOC105253545 isoform X1 [Camponotus floridanus]XP_025265439.1 uncharacterized protein LOC105253545 isoform X1 [Camponotus floridanus]XP_025265440.1 uncharacterized protein LOC105253545 isoform X1 [Camponotus floridanus]
MYSLIEFANEQKPEVEVVPNIWLEKEKEIWYCFWPQTISTKQIRKAIEKCYLPDKNWIKYKCRILHTYASYDDARKKLVDAEFTSTLETDVELQPTIEYQRPKRNVKRPFRLCSDSSDSSEIEETSCKIPSLPTLKITPTENSNILSKKSIITSYKPSTSTADINNSSQYTSNITISPSRSLERIISFPQNIEFRTISPPTFKITSTKNNILSKKPTIASYKPSTSTADIDNSSKCTSNVAISPPRFSERAVNSPQKKEFRTTLTTSEFHKSDFPYLILTKLMSLENSMNLLLPMVKQLVSHFQKSKIPHMENVPELPVDTDEHLENMERFLDTKQNFEYMMNILSVSGGTTIVQITRRTLEKVITNNYAKKFNWAGRAPKKAFKALKIKDLIIATVRHVEPNAAINTIENSIKDWLKLSSTRVALAEIRALKTFQQQ